MKKSIAIIFTLMMIASVFAGGAKEKIVINTADDLVGKKIGVQAGTTGELYVQENVKDAKIASFKTGMDAALDLKNGAIDAIVLDELPAKEIVARNPSLMIVDLDLATEAYAIAVKKGNAELLASINKTIADMKANGDYEALVNAFMPVDGNITIPDTVTINTEYVNHGTEFRAVWVSPLTNDISAYTNQQQYKKQIIEVLEKMEFYNLNVMLFHVRLMNDAVYESKYNSWSSYYNTNPDWDALPWIIEECHKQNPKDWN